ncbi:hypothetical protein GGQ88_004046 [Novosphingobium hassiacum]|uniref:Transglycosylase SLT domain-containing protein n=1 Tax=Novosphingobium hassiacum TaxID=173676 RepID=A0A7W6EYD9_9SPHN|nr:lytic transglycosylase domain-containing protein [Novosphingobium hassiacum]MBB3862744.1 hypothetical protein [Novosphingobium hassiacum]
MRIRFALRHRRRAVRLAGAAALTGCTCFLFPAIALLAPSAAAAQVTRIAAHPYAPHVAEAAQRFGIPEAWIWAVMRVESNGDAAAVSHVGAMGLMQIMPGTWSGLTARYGLGDNPWDVRGNILAGAAYLREMADRYGDLPSALAAYNAGPGRVDDWRARGRSLPAETVAYVAKIVPTVGASGIASRAGLRAVSHTPIARTASSWRSATLFALRGDGGQDGENAASGSASVAQVNLRASTSAASPALRTVHISMPPPHGLFASVSGGSE